MSGERKPEREELIVPDGWGFAATIDRRDFLKLTTTGLLVMFSFAAPRSVWGQRWNPAALAPSRDDFNAFVHIAASGRVTVLVGKIEMGQGVMTSLPQLVAEELRVALGTIDVVMGDTDLCPFDMGTFGSLSVRTLGPVLRAAAAEARGALLELASKKLGVPIADLQIEDGVIRVRRDPTRQVGYGELTAGKRITRRLDEKAALAAVADFKVIGTSPPRRDGLDKVTGRAKYAGDVAPPGALYARLLRPPAHGAKLLSVDTAAAARRPGVRVVRDGDLVAVLHAHWDEADEALALVKATFGPAPSTPSDASIFDHLEKHAPSGSNVADQGSLASGKRLATRHVEQKYKKGYVAHAAMETHSAVAAVAADGKVSVWASTQTPFPLQTQVARALGLSIDRVRIITPYVGGGFGGKSAGAQALEAARLAVLVKSPVRVVWDRTEELFFDTFDPAAVITIAAGLGADQQIVYWDYEVVGAGERGAAHFYDIPHHRTVARGGWSGNPRGLHPFAVGPWRAPGANANTFARESHFDALAHAAGVDPVEYRLRHLKGNPRMQRVLKAAASKFGWTPAVGPSRRGFGVALGIDAGTYVATCVEAKVTPSTGEIQVLRVVCAQDMGVVVNPAGALQQLEGCITMGLGYTLREEVRFADSKVLDHNFPTYRIPRFSWTPSIEGILLHSPDLPAQGGGEPAIITVGGAVANAVFDASGMRLAQLPMTEARVKAALR